MPSLCTLLPPDFVSGLATYEDHYPGQRDNAHIVVWILVEQDVRVQAIVDTGASWCILAPDIAQEFGFRADDDDAIPERVTVRGWRYDGFVHRMPVTLEAAQGDSLTIDASVFVPNLVEGQIWSNPNFVGMSDFLDRLRCAIDPTRKTFYFGEA